MPMQRAPSSRLASGMLDTFSSLNSEDNGDMNMDPELAEDEEFAAEEHAHRCAHLMFVKVCCFTGDMTVKRNADRTERTVHACVLY